MVEILCGDCVEAMKAMPESSVDAIVCDPPYGLEFMGKEWDRLLRTDHESDDATGRGSWAFGGTPSSAKRVDAYRAGKTAQDWHQAWATEALRVLKPGGHLLAFGGTRTYHRLACAIEDAGFEIRDSLIWLYGSGFPKSLDVSKAIDKAARGVPQGGADPTSRNHGNYRTTRTEGKRWDGDSGQSYGAGGSRFLADGKVSGSGTEPVVSGVADAAADWNGWGTALKPGHEPIVMARKPLSGTVAQNVTEHGTGALNIDGCRIEGTPEATRFDPEKHSHEGWRMDANGAETAERAQQVSGRWPANVALSHLPECEQMGVRKVKTGTAHRTESGGNTFGGDNAKPAMDDLTYAESDGTETITAYNCAPGCPIAELDEQSGEQKSGTAVRRHVGGSEAGMFDFNQSNLTEDAGYGDSGGASRFFYQAKASRGERNAGLDGFEEKIDASGPMAARGQAGLKCRKCERWKASGNPCRCSEPDFEQVTFERPATANRHPTVKPIDLMRWLVRLVTPPGGTVLDPFTGSGTTGIAAVLEGFDFIGIEREAEYVEIARARLAFWEPHGGRDTEDVLVEAGFSERLEREHREAGQMGLLDG